MKRLILHFFQVMWTRLKYLLDWVSWAIPFYDEIHLVMLIWMIVMGPSVRFITAWRHSLRWEDVEHHLDWWPHRVPTFCLGMSWNASQHLMKKHLIQSWALPTIFFWWPCLWSPVDQSIWNKDMTSGKWVSVSLKRCNLCHELKYSNIVCDLITGPSIHEITPLCAIYRATHTTSFPSIVSVSIWAKFLKACCGGSACEFYRCIPTPPITLSTSSSYSRKQSWTFEKA